MDKLFLLCFTALVKGQILRKLEHSAFLLADRTKNDCPNALGGRQFGKITAVHSPFKSRIQAWGSAERPALGLKIGIKNSTPAN